MTDTEIKLARATAALDGLYEMVRKNPAIKPDERLVTAAATLAVLQGGMPMPDHWREAPTETEVR